MSCVEFRRSSWRPLANNRQPRAEEGVGHPLWDLNPRSPAYHGEFGLPLRPMKTALGSALSLQHG
jgi:hypothetical protein